MTESVTGTDGGFQLPPPVSFSIPAQTPTERPPARSALSQSEAIQSTQLVELSDGEGTILYYPKQVRLDVGDVLFLKEREETESTENGVIVQVVSLGTARYPQADTKALFRLMVNVRASTIERSHNEPPEVIDEFLLAEFKVRASIVKGEWRPPEGRVVTRNVDIFWLDPTLLAQQILVQENGLNLHLGDYKAAPVTFFGGGFEKINLITGMKGSGKSHIAKGIISESLVAGMSAIVFDINNEYRGLRNSVSFVPGQNLRFRLDRIHPRAFIDLVERVAPFAERTGQVARAELPAIIQARCREPNHVPDLEWLRGQANNVIRRGGEPGDNMRAAYTSSLGVVESYHLIMTEQQALMENALLASRTTEVPDVVSLSSALHNIEHGQGAGVIIFDIGGLMPFIQFVVVDLILDTLKEICRRQTQAYRDSVVAVPQYPTIFFEEAHMYMEPKVIDELLPLIRHHGMNVFFITNTPGALPDSVFRLMDNLVMARMLNKRDIDQVKNCGLTDAETIEGFARNLAEHHALLLSAKDGTTSGFPLVFRVRDFELPASGETRSMWQALKNARTADATE